MEVKRLKVALDLEDNDLKYFIETSSQVVVGQIIKKNIPLIGAVEIEIQKFETPLVNIYQNVLKFTHRMQIRLVPAAHLIPEIYGEIELDSDLFINKSEKLAVSYKITRVIWLDGPKSKKGKTLRLIDKLSSVLLKNTEIIESLVEDKIRQAFSDAELRSFLLRTLKEFSFADLVFKFTHIHLLGWDLQVQGPFLHLKAEADARVEIGSSRATDVIIEERGNESQDVSQISISDRTLTELLLSQIDQINAHLQGLPWQLKDIRVEVKDKTIILWLLPGHLRKPIQLSLTVHFDAKSKSLLLDHCEIVSNDDSGLFVKGAIKLFGSKIEDAISNYFPLPTIPLLEKGVKSLEYLKLPFKLAIQDVDLKDVRIVDNSIGVVLKGSLVISQPSRSF